MAFSHYAMRNPCVCSYGPKTTSPALFSRRYERMELLQAKKSRFQLIFGNPWVRYFFLELLASEFDLYPHLDIVFIMSVIECYYVSRLLIASVCRRYYLVIHINKFEGIFKCTLKE